MTTITDYFEQAQLSIAAYALGLVQGMTGSDQNYVDKLIDAGMSQKQAEEFAKTYTVLNQTTNSNGFSATLFRHKSGSLHVAIRGTQPTSPADWATNFGDIGVDGIAVFQGVALFNWLQRLVATGMVSQVEYNQPIRTFEVAEESVAGLGVLSPAAVVTVTGHSLGGHLAMMMSRMASGMSSETFTFNAPGFSNSSGLTSEGFFTGLAGSGMNPLTGPIGTDWGAILGFNVARDIVHNIGGSPGTQQYIFSESANQGGYDAHQKEPITDALALYSLFASLDPSLNNSPSTAMPRITGILQATASAERKTLETTLAGVATLFQQDYVQGSANHKPVIGRIDDREKFYDRYFELLKHLKGSAFNVGSLNNPQYAMTVASLVGKSAADLEAAAQTDLATRYALYKLNPFTIEGSGLYDRINLDGALELYDPVNHTGNINQDYVRDRASFLVNKIQAGYQNSEVQGKVMVPFAGEAWYYKDVATGYELYLSGMEGALGSIPQKETIRQLQFGSWNADYIRGGNKDDRLYGMDGDDVLDTGGGNDILYGGVGNDYYIVSSSSATTRIEDKQGSRNVVEMNGFLLKYFIKYTDQTYYMSPDDRFSGRYEGTDFVITDTVVGNKVILNVDFQEGDFGIDFLDEQTFQTNQVAPPVWNDTTQRQNNGTSFSDRLGTSDELDLNGVEGSDLGAIYGTAASESIDGQLGDDDIFGAGGADRLTGGDGSDWIIHGLMGWAASEAIYIEGGSGRDAIIGGTGNDHLIGDTAGDSSATAGDDAIQGDAGDDQNRGQRTISTNEQTWLVLS